MQRVDIAFVKCDIRLFVGKFASTTQVDPQRWFNYSCVSYLVLFIRWWAIYQYLANSHNVFNQDKHPVKICVIRKWKFHLKGKLYFRWRNLFHSLPLFTYPIICFSMHWTHVCFSNVRYVSGHYGKIKSGRCQHHGFYANFVVIISNCWIFRNVRFDSGKPLFWCAPLSGLI